MNNWKDWVHIILFFTVAFGMCGVEKCIKTTPPKNNTTLIDTTYAVSDTTEHDLFKETKVILGR